VNAINQPIFYAFIMLVAGLGIPIMAALNGGLGGKLQSPVLATVILFSVGYLASLLILLLSEGVPTFNNSDSIPKYYFLGGLFVIFYILSITWVAPKFGIGNAISFVLLGQLISMTIIDHFSLLGAANYTISMQRSIGLILMVIGVFLVVRKTV
jgi:transporter family-2 protein